MKKSSMQRQFVTAEVYLCVLLIVLGNGVLYKTSRADAVATYLQCPSQCSCLGNVVDCSKRSLTKVPKSLPDWVELLDLCGNSIKSIDAEEIKGLDRLSEINLSDNPLESINCSLFTWLPKLKIVKLANCRLSELPDCQDAALNITHFSLDHNNIGTLDSGFLSSLVELKSLDLSYNRICLLNASAFPFMPQLNNLFLSNNNLAVINRGVFDNLVSLQWLKLNRNKVQLLQKNTFLHLGQLRHLELERNRLRVIEGLVFNGLDNLLTLKLRRNVITELMDGAFWRLSRIKELDISHNNISSVSNKWLYGLESLLELSLAYNQISQIEEESWKFCQNLIQLDLSYNLLLSLPSKAFEKLESLRQLSLSHNRLSVIADGSFDALSSLHGLDLSFNEISLGIEDRMSPFYCLKSLTSLNLQQNSVKFLSNQNFEGLTKLRLLQLSDNNITSIQANAFESLKELREFHLNSSQFFCDCQLSWLKHWISEAGVQSTVSAHCCHPESLRDRNILDLAPTDFKCVSFPKPIITREPELQMAIRHGNMTLTCQAAAAASSPLTIEWRKDNVVVTDGDVTTVVTDIVADDMIKVTSLFSISPVLDAHAGSYQCIASNALGTSHSHKATVTVNVYPTFLKTPSNVVAKSGTTARLDCAATGFPQPEISLQKDGGDDFPAARERRMHIFPSDEMFFIVDVKTEDQGLYSCIARNDVGVITANASLHVLEAPSFVKHMENKKTSEGETTVLECMASGSPQPRLEWMKDGAPLQPTLRHFFTADDQLLVIVQTQTSDAGDYTCVMTNTLGSERQTSRLAVALGDPRSSAEDTTTGIVIIAVVCCVVGTSLMWVIVIYKTRQKQGSDDGDSANKGLAAAYREQTCYDRSLPTIGIQGFYCPMQAASFSSSDVNGMRCQHYRHDPSSVYPSDTEDDEEDDKQRYLYCHQHHHELRLAEGQICRQRSDSGTHTASSSLSSCTSSSRTGTKPLHRLQSFPCPNLQVTNSEMADTGQILAVIHLQSNLPSHHEKHKRFSSSSILSTNASQNSESAVRGGMVECTESPRSRQLTSGVHVPHEVGRTAESQDLIEEQCKKNLPKVPSPGTVLPVEDIKEAPQEEFMRVTSDCINIDLLDCIVPEVSKS